MSEVTQILDRVEHGDSRAADELLPLVYDELRKLATQRMGHEKPGQTLQGTALVHEAYLRLVGNGPGVRWNGRGHFFGAAAEAMRRILVENARGKMRQRHGGGRERAELREDPAEDAERELLELNDAFDKLAEEDSPAAEIAKLHIFAGMSIEEAADVLNVSRASAYRHWNYAKAWLRCEIADSDSQ